MVSLQFIRKCFFCLLNISNNPFFDIIIVVIGRNQTELYKIIGIASQSKKIKVYDFMTL
jgi:hypothetical protein